MDAPAADPLRPGTGHPPPCASPGTMEHQRQRDAERRPARVVTPQAKARWNRTYKLSLKGLTPERFQELLRAQGCASNCH